MVVTHTYSPSTLGKQKQENFCGFKACCRLHNEFQASLTFRIRAQFFTVKMVIFFFLVQLDQSSSKCEGALASWLCREMRPCSSSPGVGRGEARAYTLLAWSRSGRTLSPVLLRQVI